MVGGTRRDVERARPVLAAMGSSITHMGPIGAGQATKAVNQVILAGTYLGVAEGIVLAIKAGLDPDKVVAALSGGAARSWVLENRSSRMIANEYPLGFRIALHLKDVAIALELARRGGRRPCRSPRSPARSRRGSSRAAMATTTTPRWRAPSGSGRACDGGDRQRNPAEAERVTAPAATADIGIVGAGILGLATALRLLQAHPGPARRAAREGARRSRRHQTGHNSGVVHAGLYYAPGSLKARLCREGKRDLEAYCDEHGIAARADRQARHRPRRVGAAGPGRDPRARGRQRGPRARGGRARAHPRARAPRSGIRALWSPSTGHRRLPARSRAPTPTTSAGAAPPSTRIARCDRHRSARRRARRADDAAGTSSRAGSSSARGSSPTGSRR